MENALDWNLPYAWPRKPVLAANVVATTHPLAVQAGLRMLQSGGNAVDAALAAAITLTLVEPVSNGIGSDLFAMVWHEGRLHGLNSSGRSPAGWTPEFFAGQAAMPERGWNSVTVPGCVAGWRALSDKLGKLPFAELFAPAIGYGRSGYLVSPTIARQWAAGAALLGSQPGFAEAFMPGGRAPAAGEVFRFPDHAATLERIAASGGEDFYRGDLARSMAAHCAAHGGVMRAMDLARHECDWVEPLHLDYRGLRIHELPPNGWGLTALIALGILEGFDLAALDPDSDAAVHLQIEAVKLAFADAYRYIGDPGAMDMPPARLLDRDYLRQRADLIDPQRAQDYGHGTPPRGGTVYLSAADAAGTMVSLIQSNYLGFGSGVVVPRTGISLQNRGSCFVLDPGHPNQVAPRKRPLQTIIPGFVTRDGKPLMSFGVMGGTMQPQGHVQVVTRMADHGQNPQAAVDAPRFRVDTGLAVNVEEGFPAATLEGLARRGHQLLRPRTGPLEFGNAQIVRRIEGGYLAASDSRRDGIAMGF